MNSSHFYVPAVLLTLAPMSLTLPASATNYPQSCRLGNATCVGGAISVRNNETNWSFTIKDNKKDGNCAYAKIIIDRDKIPDVELQSPRACGAGNTVSYTDKTPSFFRTVGARVFSCVDRNLQPDSCTEAFYEPER